MTLSTLGLGISTFEADAGYKAQYKALLYGSKFHRIRSPGLCEKFKFDPKQVFQSIMKYAAECGPTPTIENVRDFLDAFEV